MLFEGDLQLRGTLTDPPDEPIFVAGVVSGAEFNVDVLYQLHAAERVASEWGAWRAS
ncbi:MAG TPA: hypothetical protein VFQ35_25245 [Polyangiaceae bacterium]|nr:hypothetical protein [Polyangiaceae bacterium]